MGRVKDLVHPEEGYEEGLKFLRTGKCSMKNFSRNDRAMHSWREGFFQGIWDAIKERGNES